MRVPRSSIIGVAAGLGIALLVGGAYFFGASNGASKASASQGSAPQATPTPTGPGPMYTLQDVVVNLADSNLRRYLKIGLSIEFNTDAAAFEKATPDERKAKQAAFDAALAPKVPLINDAIIGILSARTSADISTPEGKQKLKNDIKDALNRLLGGDQVSNVYFTQFVMQ